jgi:hypothetical protein
LTSLNSDSAVPQLKYGGVDIFKKCIAIASMEKYKKLGKHNIYEAYYEPLAVDPTNYNVANDPYQVEKSRLREAYEQRDKEIDVMSMDRMSMFAYLISMTSKESLDELQGNKDWKMINTERDPLNLQGRWSRERENQGPVIIREACQN